MIKKKKAIFSWSGGKDSALALQKILQENQFEIVTLLTTISKNKSSVHAIPISVLQQQANSIGIPLTTITVDENLSNYCDRIKQTLTNLKQQHITHIIFGDLSASENKIFREKLFHPLGIEIIEPLYHKTSEEIITDFLQSGIKAKIIVTKENLLHKSYIGKDLCNELIKNLPPHVDVCGDQGEYHTIAYKGGIFKTPIHFTITSTKKVCYKIKLANNQIEEHYYWQAIIK